MPLYTDPHFNPLSSFPRSPRPPRLRLRGNLIPLFIGVLFLMTVGVVLAQCGFATPQRAHALSQAHEYIETMHPSWVDPHVTCQGIDTDSNGYVSCTIATGNEPPEAIECAAYVLFTFNRGCRPVRFVFPVR